MAAVRHGALLRAVDRSWRNENRAELDAMNRRAVVVGSQTGVLSGVINDARAIGKRLEERGFEVDLRCAAADATRLGILDALERLILDSKPADAAVFYYSGHGAYFHRDRDANAPPLVVQCLVPTDFGAPAEAFNGLLDVELSLALWRLTGRTRNVTVILDCCHSSRMMRDAVPYRVAKVIAPPWDERLDKRLREACERALPAADGNPFAVRVAAAEQDRFAFEDLHEHDGEFVRMGNLTQALVGALDEAAGAPLSWRALMARVREVVMAREPSQCPELAGPRDRLPFSEELAPSIASHEPAVFCFHDGRPAVRAGRLLGAMPGQTVYEILPRDVRDYREDLVIARAHVTHSTGTLSIVELRDVTGPAPRAGDWAIPIVLPFPRLPLEIVGTRTGQDHLETLVDASRYLSAADASRGADGQAPLRIRIASGFIDLLAEEDRRLTKAFPNTDTGREFAIRAAERWSRAVAIRELRSHALSDEAIEIVWGKVERGARVPLAVGSSLHVGDYVFVDIINKSARKLWVGILDIGVTGNVSLLTDSTPQGRILHPAGAAPFDRFCLGEIAGKLVGLGPLAWASDGPDDPDSQPEWLVVIASEHEADFASFETPAELRPQSKGSGVDALFAAIVDGHARDVPKRYAEGGYCVRRVEFYLHARRESERRPTQAVGRGVLARVGRREDRVIPRLSEQDLAPADVLLSLGEGTLSEAIQALDGGWYSHAALWAGADVIESTDPKVVRRPLDLSIRSAGRRFVDVYRNRELSEEQRTQIVANAVAYVGRTYAYGELLLGAGIIASGSFLFRTSDHAQRAWLHAINVVRSFLTAPIEAKANLVTCAELVARSYNDAGAPLHIDISGLRMYKGAELRQALGDMARRHLPSPKGGEPEVLAAIRSFQERFAELGLEAPSALLTMDSPQPRALQSIVRAGADWSASMVTPRDIMQSLNLDLIGTVYP